MPPLNIGDAHAHWREIAIEVWNRLPEEVRAVLGDNLVQISEIPEWNNFTKEMLRKEGIKTNYARVNQVGGSPKTEVEISSKDCLGVSNDIIAGALVHELGHAYQIALTPDNLDKNEKAGDGLPIMWGFEQEIAAVRQALTQINAEPVD